MTELLFARAMLGYAVARARALRAADDKELGATALEWAVISAIVITAAVVIGGIIYNIVSKKGDQLKSCDVDPSATGCGGGGAAQPSS